MDISAKTKEGMKGFVKRRCSSLRSFINEQGGVELLDTLSPLEREVIELRLKNYTLEEIGEKLGMFRPNIYKIQKRAKEKIKQRGKERDFMW